MEPKMIGKWPQLFPAAPSIQIAGEDEDGISFDNGNPINVIRVMGFPKAGKTSFALRMIARPANSEDKPVIAFSYEGGVEPYRSHYAMRLENMRDYPTPAASFGALLAIIEKLPAGEHAVALFDPAEDMEEGASEYIVENPDKFGVKINQIKKADGSLTGLGYGLVKRVIKTMLSTLLTKVQVIVFVNHLSQKYVNNQPVAGEYYPKGKDVLHKLATLSIVLQSNGMGVPAGVVTESRIMISDYSKTDAYGVPEIRAAFPRFIPKCDANALRDYLLHPREKFTSKEMQEVNPWVKELSAAEREAAQAAIDQQRLQLAAQEAKARMDAEKLKLIDRLVSSGRYPDRNAVADVAKVLKEQGITYEADPLAFEAALEQAAPATSQA
jgi:hypothetical protein